MASLCMVWLSARQLRSRAVIILAIKPGTVAILAQGTNWADADPQAFLASGSIPAAARLPSLSKGMAAMATSNRFLQKLLESMPTVLTQLLHIFEKCAKCFWVFCRPFFCNQDLRSWIVAILQDSMPSVWLWAKIAACSPRCTALFMAMLRL